MKEPGERINQLTEAIIGAAIEVHKTLGPGFLEAVYEEALCIELDLRGVPYKRQAESSVVYKGQPIGKGRIDLLIDGEVVVELKTAERLTPLHNAQVISYLKALGIRSD
ncbi:MAG: GxxExxY protein [Candidatus Neomarinimicrobiota bacterium]